MRKYLLVVLLAILFAVVFPTHAQVYPQPPNVGLLAARPTFCATTGQYYYATDTTTLYYSTVAGTSCTWVSIGGGSGVPSSQVAPNQNAITLSQNCGTQTNCIAVKFDARVTNDCSTTNLMGLIDSASAAFTSADIGKFAFCINQSSGAVAIKGLVTGVNSATEIALASNATQTTTAMDLGIGTDDGPAANSAVALASSTGQNISVPCGMMLADTAPLFQFAANATGNYSVNGCGSAGGANGTTILLGPDFLGTAGSALGQVWHAPVGATVPFPVGSSATFSNIRITALGFNFPVTSGGYTLMVGPQVDNVEVESYGCVSHTCVDVKGGTGESRFNRLNLQQGSNRVGVSMTGQGDNVLANSVIAFLSNSAAICSASTLCDFPNNYFINDGGNGQPMIQTGTPSTTNIFGGTYTSTSVVNPIFIAGGSGAVLNLNFTLFSNTTASSISTITGAGAPIVAIGSTITGRTSAVDIIGSGGFFDLGRNTVTGIGGTVVAFGSASITGTTQTTTNIGLTSGFGSGTTVTAAAGDSHSETFTITLAGTSTTGAVATVTFPTAFFVAPQNCLATPVGGTEAGLITSVVVGTPTATNVTLTYNGTLTAADTIVQGLVCQ